jgi:urease accessory protein
MRRLVAFAVLMATPATAHGTLPGGGGFWAGLAHPFLAFDHAMVLIALGLLLGRMGQRVGVGGLVLGLIAGFSFAGFAAMQPVTLTLALVMGLILAVARPLPATITIGSAICAGIAIGIDTDGASGLIPYAGVITGVLLITLNTMALAQFLAPHWNGIVLRVAGSWIAAIALMALGLALRQSLGS